MPSPHRPTASPGSTAEPALYAATVAMGLSAGLYFAFDVSVMPGLDRVDSGTYVAVMSSVNDAIENGLFGLVFLGAFLATGLAGARLRRAGATAASRWATAALALYTVAVGVTVFVNLPLNRALARGGDGTLRELSALRTRFATSWVRANKVRTLACTAALACLGRALTLRGRTAA